jgi:SAM-dependent methyltransferase
VTEQARSPECAVDDWDAHWSRYDESVRENPAQEYRRRLIIDRLGRAGPPHRILDIGSGQGDLLASLRAQFPDAALVGVEMSAVGVARAQQRVPDARFVQRDLLASAPDLARDELADLAGWADVAVCSEVLEHVDEPVLLLANAMHFVARDAIVIITVPGGPRTQFDRHIGHRRHYRPATLRALITEAGLTLDSLDAAGFPFFNVYKSLVWLRGRALVDDVASDVPPSGFARVTMRGFGAVLRPAWNTSHLGWQLVAVARPPADALDAGRPRLGA